MKYAMVDIHQYRLILPETYRHMEYAMVRTGRLLEPPLQETSSATPTKDAKAYLAEVFDLRPLLCVDDVHSVVAYAPVGYVHFASAAGNFIDARWARLLYAPIAAAYSLPGEQSLRQPTHAFKPSSASFPAHSALIPFSREISSA